MTETQIHHPGGDTGRRPWLRSVDFAAPSALAPDLQSRVRRLADDLGRPVASRAMIELGLAMRFSPLWLRELRWREVFPAPPDDAVTTVIESSSGGVFLMILDPALVSLTVERLLGTEPDPARPLRPVTTTDRALLSRLSDLLLSVLAELWGDATGATLAVTGSVAHCEAAEVLPELESTLTVALEVELFGTHTVLQLVFPQSTLQPVATQLSRPSARSAVEDPAVSRAVQGRLGEADVDVHVQLGKVALDAGAIADLHPGDRIAIPSGADDRAVLIVDGVPVQFGRIGRSGNKRAVRVEFPEQDA